ncbi:siderophore-interacting protein [Nakamurella leprariae]|uniref:Siderophore-interacting protein n=1 Tax=Nakamurella leprariae TaxID=2803911 RepID=A0A938YGZ6_9ACTN|nr:siderophore-interacting protein [Nakamurella leprariae]MBM9467630.1 siderophore-interacting protein [Nakamurella leprariae]
MSTPTETRDRARPERPADATVTRLRVTGTARLSRSFVRITLLGEDPAWVAAFTPAGLDQWFRLFFHPTAARPLVLPEGTAEGWYSRLGAMPDDVRPIVRNYTIRAARRAATGWELDVDFVVHPSPDGAAEGPAVSWALAARPGDEVGFLDQGVLFAPPAAPRPSSITIVSDETGLPGVESITRTLPAGTPVTLVLEVPHDDDRRELPSEDELDVRWVVRGGAADAPGQAALAALADVRWDPAGYVYAAGETSFVRDVQAVAEAGGVPKREIDACAFWRREGRRRTTARRTAR